MSIWSRPRRHGPRPCKHKPPPTRHRRHTRQAPTKPQQRLHHRPRQFNQVRRWTQSFRPTPVSTIAPPSTTVPTTSTSTTPWPVPATTMQPRNNGSLLEEIDISRQQLMLVRGGRVVRMIPVSTGSGRRYCVDGHCEIARTPGTLPGSTSNCWLASFMAGSSLQPALLLRWVWPSTAEHFLVTRRRAVASGSR